MAYASKYYDPVKAHEYYEAHKKLKGRQRKHGSTAGMSERGKAIAKYVKEQINEEKKTFVAKLSQQMKDKIAVIRAELKEVLKGKSKEEKARIRAEYKERMERIRGTYKEYKSQAREYFNELYKQEVDKMQASGEFKK